MTDLPHPVTGQLFPSPVPAGTGWPDDPAPAGTPVARSAADVVRLAKGASLAEVDARVSVCSACPRLVRWREDVARDKRASYAAEPYWGRPIAGWGSPTAGVLIIGLAPAANGGNRTGRIFTGDRSGDWLFASLHRVGLAVQETSIHAGDGQALINARMVATVRCAPPDNKPTTQERDTCAPWITREVTLVLPSVRAVVCLGGYGWDASLKALQATGFVIPKPKPKFGHGAEVQLTRPAARADPAGDRACRAHTLTLLGSYHPSQQNTFTGRLTESMLDDVLRRAAELGRST
jgi:uracil-DNA glycosylase family 4